MKSAHEKEREARQRWIAEGRPRGKSFRSYCEYKRAKNDFRNCQRRACEQYITKTFEDIDNAAGCEIGFFGNWFPGKSQRRK